MHALAPHPFSTPTRLWPTHQKTIGVLLKPAGVPARVRFGSAIDATTIRFLSFSITLTGL